MRLLFLLLAVLVLLVAAWLRLWQLHQYPPGPHYDEAVELLITRSIAFGGARFFPIVPSYQGREVLFYYLNAPLLSLFGDSIFTLQISNVFSNLISLAASIALGRAMFGGRRGIIVGLAVGVAFAISFPQIWLSRQAFRTSALLLCQCLALLCLWRGLKARRYDWLWLAMGGVFAGGALYTYMASRLFPLWLLIGGALLIVLDAGNRRKRLRQGVIFFGVLGVIAAPMLVFALQQPDIFMGRLTEVTQTDSAVTLGESVVRHLKMFFIKGEDLLRYNDPGRPYLTLPEGVLMLLGMGVALWRLLRGRDSALERTAYGLALLSPLMVIPSVISVGGFPPNHMRSIGMIPLLFVLVGVGAEWVFTKFYPSPSPSPQAERGIRANPHQQAERGRMMIPRPRAEKGIVVLVIGALVIGGVLVARDYFAWAGRADLYYEADADLAAAARWLPAQVDDRTRVYITTRYRQHPTIEAARLPFPVTMLGVDTLLLPPRGETGLYIFPRSAPPADEWRDWLETGALDNLPLGPDGRTPFEAFRLADMSLPVRDVPPQLIGIENGLLELVGIDAPRVESGGRGEIVMAWQVAQTPMVSDLTPILQIEDGIGTVLYRAEPYMTGTDEWLIGERVLHRIPFQIPIGTPPSLYTLRVAWVERGNDHYVPFSAGGIWATVGALEVVRAVAYPDPSELEIAVRESHDVAAGMRLLGWNPAQSRIRPGEALLMTLFWQAALTDDQRETIEYQARLGDMPLWSGAPGYGENPSGGWIDGQLMTDHVRWPVPREMDAGTYPLTLEVGESIIDLGTVEVEGLPRLFEPPEVEQSLDVRFGDALQLYGYSLQREEDALTLDLAWRAEATIAQDYKVFVHVVDESGEIVAQQDTMPQQGSYPTSLWSAGEFVPDQYTFDNLPFGDLRLRVGLYLPADGSRLDMAENGEIMGDFWEINLDES